MSEAQNLTNVRVMPDGAWLCNIDLRLPGEDWEPVEYCARRGDKAPVNLWIIEQIDAGAVTVTDWVPPTRDIEAEWTEVRRERNKRLAASDWSQLPDAQAAMSDERKAAWTTYRQFLRDITTAFADPADIVWPVQPV